MKSKLTIGPVGIFHVRPASMKLRLLRFIEGGYMQIGKVWVSWAFYSYSAWYQIGFGFGPSNMRFRKLKRRCRMSFPTSPTCWHRFITR